MESKTSRPRSKASRKGKKPKNGKYSFGNVPDGTVWNVFAEAPPLPPPLKGDHVISVIKSHDLGLVFTTSATVPSFANLNFTLSELAEAASYTTVYDQYRIDMVELLLFAEGNTNNNAMDSLMASVIDYDDSTNLGSLEAALEYDTVRVAPLNCGHYRKFVPRIAVAAYSGAFTSFANQNRQWLDCGSPAIQHYGVKIAADASVTATGVRGIVRMRVSFRAPR